MYDPTKYLPDHPGGGSSILINAGTDVSEEFEAIHSKKARSLLSQWYIGDLEGASVTLHQLFVVQLEHTQLCDGTHILSWTVGCIMNQKILSLFDMYA